MSKLIARVNKQAGPVQSEVWSQYLQRRVMRLLLLRDQHLFRGQFRAFFAQSALPRIPLLQFYDRSIRLQLLGEELFSILPDIRRQLSLQIEYESFVEDMPTRDIDWPQTITRAINETPDQPPLRFDTRQSQQNMAIPENLLVVAILLEYQQTVQDTLRMDIQKETLNDQELLALRSMEEQVERELAAPYARALREEASHAEIDSLLEQVAPRLKPGANPYRDLIAWWENFRDLHIGQTLAQRHLTLANKHDNEQIESWLYELWIALEMLETLHESQMLVAESVEIESDRLQCLFTWQERRFRFRYQRQGVVAAEQAPGWQEANTPQPGYTIEREQPPLVTARGQVIWREAPVMLAASYSAAENTAASTPEKIQQLLGAMRLAGAHHGGICAPILPDPPAGRMWSGVIQPDKQAYTARVDSATAIHLYKMPPDMDRATLHQRLHALLENAVEALPERPAPACHGILLDRDTVNAARSNVQAGNVLCPKPHIGPDVFDLVDDRRHCLKDPRLCHMHGQAITPPFVIRVETLSELEQQSGDLRTRNEERLREAENTGDEASAEQLRGHIFLGVGATIERYVTLHGDTTSIEEYFEDWIFGEYWRKHSRHLSEEARNSLLSGEYVWREHRRTKGIHDWAAPAIQYCRALEGEIHRRIYDHYPNRNKFYPDVGQKGFSDHMTLGFLGKTCRLKEQDPRMVSYPREREKIDVAKNDWRLCEAITKRSGCKIEDFEQIIQRITTSGIAQRRNQLAHGEPISQDDAQVLRTAIIGQKEKPGILIWLVENLEPKK